VEYFVYGDDEDYKYGLTKKIKSLSRSMEDECTLNENGRYRKDYEYVVYGKAVEVVEDVKNPNRVRDLGHGGMSLDDFVNHETAREANLSQAEVAALRMYTGPFYVPWNTALRMYATSPDLLQSWATCISVLYSAVFKLSFKTSKTKVYRGVNEGVKQLPDSFISAATADDFAGGVELGFMSTSRSLEVAKEYSRRGDVTKCTVFEIPFDKANRGAGVQWVSQYPSEEELLYPPCTCLTCERVRGIDGGARLLEVRASVSNAQHNVEGITTVTSIPTGATPPPPIAPSVLGSSYASALNAVSIVPYRVYWNTGPSPHI